MSETITITGTGANDEAKGLDEKNKRAVFKDFTPFTDCISEINKTQVDNAKGLDVVMPMYNVIECSDSYSKTSGCSWQYYRHQPSDNNRENPCWW